MVALKHQLERLRPQLEQLEQRLLRDTGYTRLCLALGAIGTALSLGGAATTYWLMHEPMESVGGAVVQHLAASQCTAINHVLAGLSLTRLDSVLRNPERERDSGDSGDAWSSFGVINLESGDLEDLHSPNWPRAAVQEQLQRLPLAASPPAAQPDAAVSERERSLKQFGCASFHFELSPERVRVYPIAAPAKAAGAAAGHGDHGDHGIHGGHGGDAGGERGAAQWLAFLYGPWRDGSARKVSFALVDLEGLGEAVSGHDARFDAFLSQSHSQLSSRLSLHQPAILKSHQSLTQALPSLDRDDRKLATLRILPFSNQLIVVQLSVDHHELSRSSTGVAAGVLLMGLLGTAMVVLVSRSSQLKLRRLNEALAHESRTDGLTKVANRRAWDEALAQADSMRQRYGESYGVIVVDLDGFKQINDVHGHQQGDAVLRRTAHRLADSLRSSDLLARVGGDEFAILLTRPEATGLEELLERLQRNLTQAGIRASLGAAISGPDQPLEQTWHRADAGMFARKRC